MKDIFSDLYDRVLSFFTSQTSDDSRIIAKSRLRTVLMQDRVGFSERAMQMLKDDMIESISKYLEIEVDSFDLSIDANENATILNLSIPVLRARTDEEIDEALSLKQKANMEKTHEIVGELEELVKEKAQELAEKLSDEDKTKAEDETEEEQEESKQEEKDEEVKEETKEEKPAAKEQTQETKKSKKKNNQ